MREFGSLAELALHIAERQVAVRERLENGLEKAVLRIEKTAKSEFGSYQPAVGPFPGWDPLAEATQDEREKLGFTPDDPLLRSGDLRESVDHIVDRAALEGVVGSTSPVLVFQEFGTGHIPARPVLGPAAYRNVPAIKRLVGEAVVSGIIGGDAIHAALGYDIDVAE